MIPKKYLLLLAGLVWGAADFNILWLGLLVERLQRFPECRILFFLSGQPEFYDLVLLPYFHAQWAVISSPVFSSLKRKNIHMVCCQVCSSS